MLGLPLSRDQLYDQPPKLPPRRGRDVQNAMIRAVVKGIVPGYTNNFPLCAEIVHTVHTVHALRTLCILTKNLPATHLKYF